VRAARLRSSLIAEGRESSAMICLVVSEMWCGECWSGAFEGADIIEARAI
jgi:hypothetical protein